MGDTIVRLKTMAALQKESVRFYIDAYQRGYRWSVNEVQDLLDDIREFNRIKNKNNNQENDEFYCLQPVIVTRSGDGTSWTVIDGQQRLTTLYLIYTFYWVNEKPFRRSFPFELSYNNKPKLEKCLKCFTLNNYSESEIIKQEMSEYEDDIDCYYVMEAYKCICDFFRKLATDMNTDYEIDEMKKVFNTNMKIIWYEITDCDLEKEINVFTKINMGKIALTNAELIKALLLERDRKDPGSLSSIQTDIADQWNKIEAQLSEEEFWSFLVNEKKEDTPYATRIDFIFHVMARKMNRELHSANDAYPDDESYTVSENINKEKFSFYVFSNYVRLLKDHPEYIQTEKKHYIQIIWDMVCEYYRMFKDWYKNEDWYHMIGFLVETSDEDNIDIILKLSQIYMQGSGNDGKGHKDLFENELKHAISESVFGKQQVNNNECNDFISELKYNGRNDDIRRILLLYNIAYLKKCNRKSRFPFEKYKDKSASWDLEHINAVTDVRPEDDRRTSEDNVRYMWLISAKEVQDIDKITTADGQPVTELIDNLTKDGTYNPNEGDDFIRVYDAIVSYFGGTEPDHSIGNLTLLDSGTNRSYKNHVFPLKRKTILERSMDGVFIPLCTWKVFMKGFIESKGLLKWTDTEKEAYRKEIVECISEYLGLEGAINE